MRRQLLAISLLVGLIGATVPPVRAQNTPPEVVDPLRAYSIVPPGQEGDVTAPEAASGDYGGNYSDQLEMYASLVDDDDVTEKELEKYFHSMQFGPGATITRTYNIEGAGETTVYRDEFGIPHVYADSLVNASFALGYVTAEDRLWEMDVFRHAARGTLAEFVGPGDDDEFWKMDIDTRREGYTEEEIQRMFDRLDDKFGTIGKQVQDGLQAYADGVNQYIAESKMAAPEERPVEYEATGNPYPVFPEEWEIADTLFLVVLQLRVFGETAGHELQNAGFYAHLRRRLGARLGRKVYNDLLRRNEPRSYPSVQPVDGHFPSQSLSKSNYRSVAVPDNAEELARAVGAREASRRALLADLGFTAPSSNALLVAASESASGNPLQVGAPQVGYAVPSFFMDIDVHAPGVDFRGPAVPGASALIPLGRGRDYAWSLTTGFSDAVDTRVEVLCDPGGDKATLRSNGYMFEGKCRKMASREETFMAKPTPVDPGAPRQETRTFYRTVHGPVFERAKVDGKPVALVRERFFWKKEIDSIPQFARWNLRVDSVADFRRAASKFTMSFNTFYADAKHIAYFHVGQYPLRKKGMHPSLPTWGTGRWEWRGRLPFRRHPQVVDPRQGWLANWNNKPAVGWDSYDGFKWGSVHRVELLRDGMRRVVRGRATATLSDLVDVIREAATRDVRAVYLGPRMVRWARQANGSKSSDQAAGIVRDWVREGAHRYNRDHDDEMDDGPALAIFDQWYQTLVHRVFDDELGRKGYPLMFDAPVSDYRPNQGSSFWFDFSSFLANLFSRKARGGYARNYCDDIGTRQRESCRSQVVRALQLALKRLANTQEQPDMTTWSKPAENLLFQELGAGSVPPIPWQNRGTHNHVIEVVSDAP